VFVATIAPADAEDNDFDLACLAALDSHTASARSRSTLPTPPAHPIPPRVLTDSTAAGLLLYLAPSGDQRSASVPTTTLPTAVTHAPPFAMFGVPLVWAEARSLLVRRNVFVGALRDVSVPAPHASLPPALPPMIDSSFQCSNCSVKTACYLLGAATASGPACAPDASSISSYLSARVERSGLQETRSDFGEVTKHLLPQHIEYFTRWWRLLDMELLANGSELDSATNPATQTGFWSVPAGAFWCLCGEFTPMIVLSAVWFWS
jgi:hypothetical protein